MAKINKEKPAPQSARYFEAVGRRKTSVARVRLFAENLPAGKAGTSSPNILVNNKPYAVYFHTAEMRKIAVEAFSAVKVEGSYRVSAKLSGGGIHSQAEALRHGISRALLLVDQNHRKLLKSAGFLKRDPRMKERRKFGLKKARKAPQWAKR